MPLQRKNVGEPDSTGTTKTVFFGFGIVGLALVFALAYILGATSSDPVQHDLESNLVVVRQKVAQCGMERDRWRAKQKKKANKLSPLYTTQQENGNLQEQNNQLMDDNESLRKERDILEETINELHFRLDDTSFVNDKTQNKLQQQNMSKPLKQWVDESVKWGGIEKDSLILKLIGSLKTKKETFRTCRIELVQVQKDYTAMVKAKAKAKQEGGMNEATPRQYPSQTSSPPQADQEEDQVNKPSIVRTTTTTTGSGIGVPNRRASRLPTNTNNEQSLPVVQRPQSKQQQMAAMLQQQPQLQQGNVNQFQRPVNTGFPQRPSNMNGFRQQGFPQQPQQQQLPQGAQNPINRFGQMSHPQQFGQNNNINNQFGQQQPGGFGGQQQFGQQQQQFGQQQPNRFGQQQGLRGQSASQQNSQFTQQQGSFGQRRQI